MTHLLNLIKSKCEIEGNCWNWSGALQSCGATPTINIAHPITGKRVVMSVRRAILMERHKENLLLLRGRLATYKCGNPKCVNPDHTHAVTRSALQNRLAKEFGYHNSPVRKKKIADAMRAKSRLTMEIAEQIRQSKKTQRAMALEFGVSQGVISKIRRGQIWKDYSNPFSQLGAIKS